MKEKKRKDTVFCGFFFVRESESSEKKSSELPAIVIFCGLLIVIICLGIYLINAALVVHMVSKGADTMATEQTGPKGIENKNPDFGGGPNRQVDKTRASEDPKPEVNSPSEYVPPIAPNTESAPNTTASNESSAVKRVLTTGQKFDPSNGEPDVAICEMANGDRLIVAVNYDSLSSDLFEANLKTILSEIDEGVQVRYNDNLGGWLVTASSAEADRLSSERLLATSCVLADKLSKPISESIEAPE